eukprot:2398973-Rhodomonas_salina.2
MKSLENSAVMMHGSFTRVEPLLSLFQWRGQDRSEESSSDERERAWGAHRRILISRNAPAGPDCRISATLVGTRPFHFSIKSENVGARRIDLRRPSAPLEPEANTSTMSVTIAVSTERSITPHMSRKTGRVPATKPKTCPLSRNSVPKSATKTSSIRSDSVRDSGMTSASVGGFMAVRTTQAMMSSVIATSKSGCSNTKRSRLCREPWKHRHHELLSQDPTSHHDSDC